jgi:putative nucleotidyltransferase with HDIG domain
MSQTEEKLGMGYERANELVDKYIKDPIVKMHCIESEAIMRALAKKLGEDEEIWGTIGLLHDIDWDQTKNNPSEHCVKAVDILKSEGATDFLIETVVSHGYDWGEGAAPELKGKKRASIIQHALVSAETLTGLIVASSLVQQDKKLASVSLHSLQKKFKDKGFAARCNRELIKECEEAGIPLDEFLEIGLKALQAISDKLGL